LETLVRSHTQSLELFNLAGTIVRDLWDCRKKCSEERRAALKLEAAGMDKRSTSLNARS
jgi:hypothetical protein